MDINNLQGWQEVVSMSLYYKINRNNDDFIPYITNETILKALREHPDREAEADKKQMKMLDNWDSYEVSHRT